LVEGGEDRDIGLTHAANCQRSGDAKLRPSSCFALIPISMNSSLKMPSSTNLMLPVSVAHLSDGLGDG